LDYTITRIETEQIRVLLERVYQGSHYKMTHRSTIITHVHTVGSLVGEAYAGDEGVDLAEINGVTHDEIALALLGQNASAIELCWELAPPATWNILRDCRLGLVACAWLGVTF
jgi:D-galactarolactone cycloisomerase